MILYYMLWYNLLKDIINSYFYYIRYVVFIWYLCDVYIDCTVLHISHSIYILLILWVPAKMQFCVVQYPQHVVSGWIKSVWIKFFHVLPELAEPGLWMTFSMLPMPNWCSFSTLIWFMHTSPSCNKHSP